MILLKRLNGSEFGVNADLIERLEVTPDTVVTLVDGTKYVVAEPVDEVIEKIIDFRARILATAEVYERSGGTSPASPLRLVPETIEEG